MPINETFSVLFSIRAFLIDVLAQEMAGLRCYLNPILLPHEKEEMQTLTRYLRITITEGEINWEQPFDVAFHLWQRYEFDPSTLWLQKTTKRLIQAIINTRTDTTINMIALYDFDTVFSESDLNTFYQTGVLPSNLLTTVQKRNPDIPYRTITVEGETLQIGLKALPTTTGPRYDYDTVPMNASWNMTFKYFEPNHQKAVRPGT